MKRDLTEQELLHKAAAYCSTCERCISEVQNKLTNWGATPTISGNIVKRLINERFIDEARYTRAFVKDKSRFNSWGKIKVKYALMQKKIDPELINEALETLEDENYQETLEEILRSKLRTIKDDDQQKVKAKLFRFGASKGFESSLIMKTISKILKNDTEDME